METLMKQKQCDCLRDKKEMCHHDMVKLLSQKLSKEEFRQFAQMVDGDPPAGPFWESVQDKNIELNPEEYQSYNSEKEEV